MMDDDPLTRRSHEDDSGILGTPEPSDERPLDAPWEPSGVPVGIPMADLERPARVRRAPEERARDPGYVLRGVGWSVAILGALLYLYVVWSTADRVLRGVPDAARRLEVAGLEVLWGSVALALVLIGVIALAAGYLVPPRRPVPTVPGNTEYEAYVEDLAVRVRMNNGARWAGLFLFVVGLLVALYPLRQAAAGGDLATFDAVGTTLNTHSVGMALALLGAVLFLVLGARQRPLDELLLQTRTHRTLHARRGPLDEGSWPTRSDPDEGPLLGAAGVDDGPDTGP